MNPLRPLYPCSISVGLWLLAACGSDSSGGVEPPPPATTVSLNDGNNQTGVPGTMVATAPSVKVTDTNDDPVSGYAVTFAVTSGGGQITDANQMTNASGIATVGSWKLGATSGINTVIATAGELSGSPVTFTATGTVPGLHVATVSTGHSHTCGITPAGAAYCWGTGLTGELGDGAGTENERLTPALVAGGLSFASVNIGPVHSCGITTAGAAYCWGWNLEGQLGVGTSTGPESCLFADVSVPCSTVPVPVAGGLSFASVSAGRYHTCGVTTAGAAYCWGNNSQGLLGVGTSTGPETCTYETGNEPCSTLPVPVVGGLSFTSVSVGQIHTCGVTTSGDAYCWGAPFLLGGGTPTSESRPVLVAGGLSFTSTSAGDFHTCGITAAGAVHCWGQNPYGGIGDGTDEFRTTPVPVVGGLSFASISVGWHYTCGVTLAGAAYCWGWSEFGGLGNGSTDVQLAPVPVAGGLSFASVSTGPVHTCGVTSVTEVYCWGSNFYGQLGDGTKNQRLTPVRVVDESGSPSMLSNRRVHTGGRPHLSRVFPHGRTVSRAPLLRWP